MNSLAYTYLKSQARNHIEASGDAPALSQPACLLSTAPSPRRKKSGYDSEEREGYMMIRSAIFMQILKMGLLEFDWLILHCHRQDGTAATKKQVHN